MSIISINTASVLKQSLFSMSSTISRVIVAFLSVPLCVSYLGSERYGLWMIVISALSFVYILDAGITPYLKNKMAKAFNDNDADCFRLQFQTGLLLGVVLMAIFLIASILFSFIDWATVFNVNNAKAKAESTALIIVLLFVVFNSLALSFVENYYAATLQLGKIKLYETIANFVMLLAIYLLVKFESSLPLLAFVYSSPRLIVRLSCFTYLAIKNKALFTLGRGWKNIIISNLRISLKKSSAFLGMTICEAILSALPSIYIARFLSLEAVTQYSVIYKMVSLPLIALSAIFPIVWPAFTIAWSQNNKSWILKNLNYATIITGGLYLGFLGILLVAGDFLIRFWTKDQVLFDFNIFLFVGLSTIAMAITYWQSTFLHSISDFKFEFILHAFLVLGIVTLGVVGTKLHGVPGLAFVQMIFWLFIAFIPMYLRGRKFLISSTVPS